MSTKPHRLYSKPLPGEKQHKLTFIGHCSASPRRYDVECECGARVTVSEFGWGKIKACINCTCSTLFFQHDGKPVPLARMCKIKEVDPAVVRDRIKRGLPETDWFRPVYGDDGLCTIKREERLRQNYYGKRFGTWLVLSDPAEVEGPSVRVKCLCDCGVERWVETQNLKSKRSEGCGCVGIEKRRRLNSVKAPPNPPYYANDYPVGRRIGRLTITSQPLYNTHARCRQESWGVFIKCDCGTEKIVPLHRIRNWGTSSCGCPSEEPSPVLAAVSPTRDAASVYQKERSDYFRQAKVGKKFGQWAITPRESAHPEKKGHFLCQCNCGAKKVVALSNLRSGASSSCGCRGRKSA